MSRFVTNLLIVANIVFCALNVYAYAAWGGSASNLAVGVANGLIALWLMIDND